MEEQSEWPAHASFMDGLVDAGFIVLGGPFADECRVVHVVEAESEAPSAPRSRAIRGARRIFGSTRSSVDDPARRAPPIAGAGTRRC